MKTVKTLFLILIMAFSLSLALASDEPMVIDDSIRPNPPRPVMPDEDRPFGESRQRGEKIRGKMADQWNQHKEEFTKWLETNYPQEAIELSNVEKNSPENYRAKMLDVLRKFGPIFKAEKENPELAILIKEDMVLREKTKLLAEEIKIAKTEQDKSAKTVELKELLNQRFDILIKQREINYEDFKKRIEKLQKELAEKEQALIKLRENKTKEVDARLDDLLVPEEKLNWD